MKKFKLNAMVFTGVACLFVSCTTGGGPKNSSNTDTVAQNNLKAVNAIDKAIETGNVDQLGNFIAQDGVDHSNPGGDVKGLDNIKKGLSGVHALAAGDMKLEIKKEVADSDYVFQWIHLTGTAATTDMGVPVGHKFELNTIGVSKFKNGKATDYWEFMQPAEMMKMMGGGSPGADKGNPGKTK